MSETCPECGEALEGASRCSACGHELDEVERALAGLDDDDDFEAFLDDFLDDDDEEEEMAGTEARPTEETEPEPDEQGSSMLDPSPTPEPEPDFHASMEIPILEVIPFEEVEDAAPPPTPHLRDYIRDESNPEIRAHLIEAERCVDAGDYEGACARFEAALEIRVNQEAVLLRWADLADEAGDEQRLSRCYVTLAHISSVPSDRADYLVEAALIGHGDATGRRTKALTMALQIDPGHERSFNELKKVHRQTHSWMPLAVLCQTRIQYYQEHPPEDEEKLASVWDDLALALARLGKKEDARVAKGSAMRIRAGKL